jgi:hypothetical protein
MPKQINPNEIVKDLNEFDWKVLFSFGFSGRYIKVYEINEEQAIIPTIKLYTRGLLDYFRDPNAPDKSYYGLNENGANFINAHQNELPKELLFGAKIRTE